MYQYDFRRLIQVFSSFYDLVIELDSGPLYVAREDNGTVLTTMVSSNGQKPILVNGTSLSTTIFTIACEGNLTMATIDTTYAWQVSGDHSIAPVDPHSSSMVLILPTRLTVNTKEDKSQGSKEPRCPDNPPGLVAWPKDHDRSMEPNGCGVKATGWLVPDGSFRPACNHHDNCYGTCSHLF